MAKWKIEYAYISNEIKNIYEKDGGAFNENRLLIKSFHINNELITGLHIRGGFYGQISKHFFSILNTNLVIPKQFLPFIRKRDKLGYCGIHATNISKYFFIRKQYKQQKKINYQQDFINYLINGGSLLEYQIDDGHSFEPILIDIELSKQKSFR